MLSYLLKSLLLLFTLSSWGCTLAQIQIRNRRPAANASVDLNQRVNFQLRASSSSGNIDEVKFTFRSPGGAEFDMDGTRRNRRYRARKRLKKAGTWQWMVTVTDSSGQVQTSDWRNIVVGDDSTPTPPTAPTPTAPTPTTPSQPTPTSSVPIEAASNDIRALLNTDRDLGAKFVRLGFHMCVGGSCDGCVDMTNVDNRGLDIPIDAIASIVSEYQSSLSRADIWALAALISSEEAQTGNNQISFPFEWYGRNDCSSSDGKSTDTSQSLPSPDLTTHQLFTFFSDHFGLSTRETVALMGAHTIGSLSRENSGFDGPNGWANNNNRLDNGYYDGIVGGNENQNTLEQTSLETLIRAPNWTRQTENNNDIDGIPNRQVWVRNRNGGRRTIMTNADIAIVRNFEDHINENTGAVSCTFRNRRNPCPVAEETLRIAAEFKFDVNQWKAEFRDVFTKVLLTGHDASATCSPPCQLP